MRAGFVRAERRNSGKLFCKFFARFRREVCVISTPDARLFGCQRNHDFLKSFEDVMRVAAQAGRVHEFFFVRAARRNFSKILQFLRRESLDAKRAQFRNATQCRLGQPQRRFFEYAQRSLPGSTHFLRAARRHSDFLKMFFNNFFFA